MFPDLTRDDVFRLETRRLWLRWPRLADVPAMVRLAGEKAVAEMTARIPHPNTHEDAERFVFHARQSNADGNALQLAITPKGRPRSLIGMIGIAPNPKDGSPSLGYWVGMPHWGEGYATEAARALIDAFFTYGREPELFANARVVNPASRRVLEKCGFAYLGSGFTEIASLGGSYPVDHFRLDRKAWESLKAWGQADFVREASSAQAPAEAALAH